MTEYQCQSCKYRFNSNKQPLKCPYCGKAGTVKEPLTAEQIMEEVSLEEKK